MNIQEFQEQLSHLIYIELLHWRGRFQNETINVMALDCYPWNEGLELSFLVESDEDGNEDKTDSAAWRWFQFTNTSVGGWPAANNLAKQMGQSYSKKELDPKVLFETSAKALMSDKVKDGLKGYNLSDSFEFVVSDPDDPKANNYCMGVTNR
ncbi:hypothetical protein [Marinicella meishanensis]|uniref:hypothetical protein n=1 Tax=Marinicella meishanensis TaxID=2873263 RepID=UPI001CBE2930|nr:hypothetical protein [Marinicella sp. NBU2979]